MEYSLIFSLAFCVFFYARMAQMSWLPNPFTRQRNDDCDLSSTSNWIKCNASLGWPSFKSASSNAVPNPVNIQIVGNVSAIPADAFAPFKSINILILENSVAQYAHPLQWDKNAFRNVTIAYMWIKNLASVFPLPEALQPLGDKLTHLNIERVANSVSLKREAFAWFPKLQEISITNTQISHIENAFNGSTNLWSVTLESTGLCSSPSKTVIACNDAIPFGNDVHHIDVSGLSELPESVSTLTLDANNLTAIPAELIKNSPGLKYLHLKRNQISSLNFDDIAGSTVSQLHLSENPITKIDVTFQPIALSTLYVKQTELTTIDLSSFTGMNLGYLSFDNTPSLKTLTMSGEPPGGMGCITLNDCGLETIHPNVSRIFGQNSERTPTLKITNCKKLQCHKDMAWMAKPRFCLGYGTIYTYQSECLNLNKTLDEHLKELVPKPCDKA